MDIKIAIKDLASFVYQTGNLTSEIFSNKDFEIGKRAHKYHQSKYSASSESEVYIKYNFSYCGKELLLHGFIDGIIKNDDEIIIEEIKSTSEDLDEVDPNKRKEYLAQLKLYGYLYALINSMETIHLRLTFISIDDYTTKSFDYILKLDELEEFCFSCLETYLKFLNLTAKANDLKIETIKTIKFPFENMRQGQRSMMSACFKTMKENDILYCIAPTGIGKTMATLFSSLKTLDINDKLFYLTAKGSGKNAPLQAIKLLEERGLRIKTISITAKKKICNAKLKNCSPDDCPYALGYFDRLRSAITEIFEYYDTYDSEILTKIANKYKICAFEFSLDLSYYCDVVIADYNYVFDPRAHLIRYFEDDTYHPKVLVDEAHNLISRSKDMYSSLISEEDLRVLRKALTGLKPSIKSDCNKAIEKLTSYKEYLVDKTIHVNNNLDTELVALLKSLLAKCDNVFTDNKNIKNKDEALDSYFKILDFVQIANYFGLAHRYIVTNNKDICEAKLMCLDASDYILDTINSAVKGIVFFSATLTPFKYHADLLTKGQGKFLELPSPFNPANLNIIINNHISTRYKERINSIDYILEAIDALTRRKGNYIVFFPSYQYLNMVVDALDDVDYEIFVQKSNATEQERNDLLAKFLDTSTCKVGFFVLGGIYAEGIDYIGNWLSGVIVVGVGLPMYNDENNILKDYFEEVYQNGFDYAYTYPGFTKVVQAVGRVIRSENDHGVVILIDDRFTYLKYQELMPKHWLNKKVINDPYYLKKELATFFNMITGEEA